MQEEKLYPWRWAILIGMMVLLVSLQFAFIIPGGAAVLVMQTYQIEPMWFSMIMSIPYFSGVLFCIAGGVLADRIGLNKVFAVAFIIAALGALGRCFATTYWPLFIASFFMGMGVAALNANSAKLRRSGSVRRLPLHRSHPVLVDLLRSDRRRPRCMVRPVSQASRRRASGN